MPAPVGKEPRMTLDPIRQFNTDTLIAIGHIGGNTIAIAKFPAYRRLTVAVVR